MSSENHGIKNTQHTRWSSQYQTKKSYTGFSRFWLTQCHMPHPSRLTATGLLGHRRRKHFESWGWGAQL